jgi:hypothetical protein
VGWIAKSSSPDRVIFLVFIEEIPFMEADTSDRVQLNDYITFARALGDLPMTTLIAKLLGSGTHSIKD